MKKLYYYAFRAYFRVRLVKTRSELCLTQSQMSELLAISERSYAALESGESGCSALTLALFLAFCCTDRNAFIEEMKKLFEEVNNNAA